MSYSVCIRCGTMVFAYEKYCDGCISNYGLQRMQDVDFHRGFSSPDYKNRYKEIFISDMKKAGYKLSGRINIYTCSEGHETITQDIDEGTTPMIIDCPYTHFSTGCSCKELAHSKWYNCDQTLTPTYEWYKPDPKEKIMPYEKDHVSRGGLLMRKIGQVTDSNCSPMRITFNTPGRNSPCTCGSGKKFKHCCINKI